MPAEPPIKAKTGNGDSGGTLADILASQGAIDANRAQQVKNAEIQTGKPQRQIHASQNLVSEEALARAKAALYNIPFIDLGLTPASPEAVTLIAQEVAERFKIYPVSVDKLSRGMVLAMPHPLDLSAIEFVEQKTGLRVKPQAATPSKVLEFIETRYSTTLSKEVTEALKDVSTDQEKAKTLDLGKTGLIREEKIAEIVSHILDFAMRARASDVHIEPQEKSTRILVGERRDPATADLASQAALTGHLVFSTLPNNNAPGALPRLLDMGAEP